ncbi:MAG: type II secretion system major pseudopilin GspG [Sphingopyxis sp.]|nr:type II secretion system major pseudopilin GspG [Sphingopyxis sp.]
MSIRKRLNSGPRLATDARSPDAGFTLIELLVVLAIITLLATLATPQVLGYLTSARVSATKTQLNNIGSALELYYIDVGAYPSNEQGLNALLQAPPGAPIWNGPYIKANGALRDSWGIVFQYSLVAETGVLTVTSFGRDGRQLGDGPDEDLIYSTK